MKPKRLGKKPTKAIREDCSRLAPLTAEILDRLRSQTQSCDEALAAAVSAVLILLAERKDPLRTAVEAASLIVRSFSHLDPVAHRILSNTFGGHTH